jgi:predicted nucleotidyltransferase
MRQPVPALLPLFRSEDQLRLLALLVEEPSRSWTADELVAASGAARASVHRELGRAVDAGLVVRDAGRRPHAFRADSESPIYRPLRDLLAMTVGIESELRGLLEAEDGVDAAVIHGSWARGEAGRDSDVDVLVVGCPNLTRLRRKAREIGQRAGRRIDVTAFTRDEFERRRGANDPFVAKLLDAPHIVVAGDIEGLPR